MRSGLFCFVVLLSAGLAISGCSREQEDEFGSVDATEFAPAISDAPTGLYNVDPNHASLRFSVTHLGLSNYVVRFTRFDATVDFDAADVGASSLQVDIDPTSVRAFFATDYKESHPDSEFETWDEDLAYSENFFAARQHPSIQYRSTAIEETGPGSLRILGDLTMLGQTHPVILEAELVGAVATHPFLSGRGAFGFSAKGSLKRSDFGMDYLLSPPLVGDLVTISFEGEFLQAAADPAS